MGREFQRWRCNATDVVFDHMVVMRAGEIVRLKRVLM